MPDLKYSPDAQRARAKIYEDYNDITIYVEDNSITYIYEEILKRLFQGAYRISAIIPLGGKEEVIKTYRQYKDENHKMKKFYILDGDFNRYIAPEEMIDDTCVYYLKSYSIENYIINEPGCRVFLKGKLKIFDEDINAIIQYDKWRNKVVSDFYELYLTFCAVQATCPNLPNCNQYRYNFIDQNSGFKNVENPIYDYLSSIGLDYSQVSKTIKSIKSRYNEVNGEDYFYLIDGKLLLKSLAYYLKRKIKTPFRDEDLRWTLVTNYSFESLEDLKRHINDCYPA